MIYKGMHEMWKDVHNTAENNENYVFWLLIKTRIHTILSGLSCFVLEANLNTTACPPLCLPSFFGEGQGKDCRKMPVGVKGGAGWNLRRIKKLPGFGARERICFGGIADYLSIIIFWVLE
jgi:hypothetical protein